jgi:hypothetical protein
MSNPNIPDRQERPMRTCRQERDLTRTLRRTEAWLTRFHDHGDAGMGEVPELLASLRRALRRQKESAHDV